MELTEEMLLEAEYREDMYKIYRKNPMAWVRDVLGEDEKFYRWSLHEGYENHIWDGSKDPLWAAWNCLTKKQWTSLAAATGTGKTYTAARIALWFLDCFEDAFVITTAPKEAQLMLNIWAEISKVQKRFKETARPFMYQTKLCLKAEGMNLDSPFRQSHQIIGFVAGVGADEESANKARGFHRKNMLFILEETTGIDSAIITAFKNTCTAENNLILALGNPNSEHDQLYKFSQLPNVHDFRVSAYDYPNVVLKKEIYAGAASCGSIDRRKAEYGEDDAIFKAMVRGITPTDDESSLIKGAWIDAADIWGEHFAGCKKDPEGYNGCGVDVAQSLNGDMASVAWFESNELVRIDEFVCNNATHLAYNLIMDDVQLMENDYTKFDTGKVADYDIMPCCIGVDTVGVGVATLNAFADEGFTVTSMSGGVWKDEGIIPIITDEDDREILQYSFANGRSQWYWELAEDLRKGLVRINIEDRAQFAAFKKEATAIRRAESDNYIAIEKKTVLKKRLKGKSPNRLDAVVYANWCRKAYRLTSGDLPLDFGG